ncbi:hypothetical protein MRX96_035274 [Rhipicephalus microplus]
MLTPGRLQLLGLAVKMIQVALKVCLRKMAIISWRRIRTIFLVRFRVSRQRIPFPCYQLAFSICAIGRFHHFSASHGTSLFFYIRRQSRLIFLHARHFLLELTDLDFVLARVLRNLGMLTSA